MSRTTTKTGQSPKAKLNKYPLPTKVSKVSEEDLPGQIHRKSHILIADDEDRIRDILSRKLASQGHKCITAGDGISALNNMQSQPIDLALLDINMPGN